MVLAWPRWALVPILLGMVWLLGRLPRSAALRAGGVLVLAVSVVVAVASALWFEQPEIAFAPWTPRLYSWQLLVGAAAAVVAVATLVVRRVWFRHVGSALMVSWPWCSCYRPRRDAGQHRGPGHAAYTLDELIAPAVGQVPLVDYFPQYVTLLGLPVAPVIRAWPDHALGIVLGWVLFLQVVSIVGAVLVGATVGGRRVVPFVLLLVSAPVIFATAGGVLPAAYLAAVPFRTVLPVVTIVAALTLFGRRAALSHSADRRGSSRRRNTGRSRGPCSLHIAEYRGKRQIGRVRQDDDPLGGRNGLLEERKRPDSCLRLLAGDARNVAAGPGKADHDALPHRIGDAHEDDWYRPRRVFTARTVGVPPAAKMTSTFRPANSAASTGSRS